MTIVRLEPSATGDIRAEAERRIMERRAPPTLGWLPGVSAIELIYRLASDPKTAPEALKLLHELQVHQVELDLVHLELESNQASMIEAFGQYKMAFEIVPAGLFIVDLDGVILEINPAAASFLGIDRNEAVGRNLGSLLAAQSRPMLDVLMNELRDGHGQAAGELQTAPRTGDSKRFCVSARVLPGHPSAILVASF